MSVKVGCHSKVSQSRGQSGTKGECETEREEVQPYSCKGVTQEVERASRPHYETKMARQLVVLALVLIALTGVVSAAAPASDSKAAASSPGSSPADAPAGASVDGNAAGSSPPSLATAPSPSGGVALEVSASTIVGVGAATVAGYVMF
ncbi:hypothetical protein Goarm_022232 [Gossypium armourianum]|uniref:Uncharacterized protein n=1 Tax=Gossypium armourianum TaxID=34283 RepID=A0A7J9KF82_9ROSI|nr:hypothetical protein [Gossypium armourianum]